MLVLPMLRRSRLVAYLGILLALAELSRGQVRQTEQVLFDFGSDANTCDIPALQQQGWTWSSQNVCANDFLRVFDPAEANGTASYVFPDHVGSGEASLTLGIAFHTDGCTYSATLDGAVVRKINAFDFHFFLAVSCFMYSTCAY